MAAPTLFAAVIFSILAELQVGHLGMGGNTLPQYGHDLSSGVTVLLHLAQTSFPIVQPSALIGLLPPND